MFREQISQWSNEVTFSPPASLQQIRACEAELGHPLPDQLRTLYAETNGVVGEYGIGLIWSVERVGRDNALFRSGAYGYGELYMPFEGLVFFADGGNGDQFGLSLSGNQEVFVWDHENDSRTWAASTVILYLERWMTGVLKI